MKEEATICVLCILLAVFFQSNGQTRQLSIFKDGDVSGEHAVFKFNGRFLSITCGSDRSGLGLTTEWYVFKNGAWRAVSSAPHPQEVPIVHLGACDPGNSLDLSSHFPEFRRLLSPGSMLKYVGVLKTKEEDAVVIFSGPAVNTQTGHILQISLLRDGKTPAVIASGDMGEARFCNAQWNENNDGTKDLIVFTLLPAGSSVSYAFQSFAFRE